MTQKRHKSVGVKVGNEQMGGGAPIAVPSMTNTDTPDREGAATRGTGHP